MVQILQLALDVDLSDAERWLARVASFARPPHLSGVLNRGRNRAADAEEEEDRPSAGSARHARITIDPVPMGAAAADARESASSTAAAQKAASLSATWTSWVDGAHSAALGRFDAVVLVVRRALPSRFVRRLLALLADAKTGADLANPPSVVTPLPVVVLSLAPSAAADAAAAPPKWARQAAYEALVDPSVLSLALFVDVAAAGADLDSDSDNARIRALLAAVTACAAENRELSHVDVRPSAGSGSMDAAAAAQGAAAAVAAAALPSGGGSQTAGSGASAQRRSSGAGAGAGAGVGAGEIVVSRADRDGDEELDSASPSSPLLSTQVHVQASPCVSDSAAAASSATSSTLPSSPRTAASADAPSAADVPAARVPPPPFPKRDRGENAPLLMAHSADDSEASICPSCVLQ